MSLIHELDDHLFVLATEYVADLCEEAEKGTGTKLTIDELCELLMWGIRSCGKDILADANPCNVTAIVPKLKRRGKVSVQRGDLIAIPAATGGFHRVVVAGRYPKFGLALWAFRGIYPLRPPDAEWRGAPLPHAIFVHDEYIANGRWPILGNFPNLLSLVPDEPEYYYSKAGHPEDPTIGTFGGAESMSGRIRKITEEEARAVGLLTGDYPRSSLGEQVEMWLSKHLAEHDPRSPRRKGRTRGRKS